MAIRYRLEVFLDSTLPSRKAEFKQQEEERRQKIAARRMLHVAEFFATTYTTTPDAPSSIVTPELMKSFEPVKPQILGDFRTYDANIFVSPLRPDEIAEGLIEWEKAITRYDRNFKSSDPEDELKRRQTLDAGRKIIAFFQSIAAGNTNHDLIDRMTTKLNIYGEQLPQVLPIKIGEQSGTLNITELHQHISELDQAKREIGDNSLSTIQRTIAPYLHPEANSAIGLLINNSFDTYPHNNPRSKIVEQEIARLKRLSTATVGALELMSQFLHHGGVMLGYKSGKYENTQNLFIPLTAEEQLLLQKYGVYPNLKTLTVEGATPECSEVTQILSQALDKQFGTENTMQSIFPRVLEKGASLSIQAVDNTSLRFLVGQHMEVSTHIERHGLRRRKKTVTTVRKDATDFVSIPYDQDPIVRDAPHKPLSAGGIELGFETWLKIIHEDPEEIYGYDANKHERVIDTYRTVNEGPTVVGVKGETVISGYFLHLDESRDQGFVELPEILDGVLTEMAALHGTMYPTDNFLYRIWSRRTSKRLQPTSDVVLIESPEEKSE